MLNSDHKKNGYAKCKTGLNNCLSNRGQYYGMGESVEGTDYSNSDKLKLK